MEKIALITDTAADLNNETINKYNIKVLSFRIIYKNMEYLDKVNIKSIISINNDGVYYTYAKVRGRKQSLNKLIELAKEITQKQKCEAFVMDGGAEEEECQKVYDMISELSNITNLKFGGNISPVSCVHSGPGFIGLALVEDFS